MIDNIFNYFTKNQTGIEVVLDIGAFAISIITLLWVVISGIRSLKNIILDRKIKQLTDFIMLFSDENEIKRLSGINGLSRYSKTLFRELFFICSIEKDTIIKELIYDSLQKESKHMTTMCIQINDFLVSYILYHDTQDNSLIDSLIDIKKDDELVKILRYSKTERKVRLELNHRNPTGIFVQNYAINNHLLLSSNLLASSLSKSFSIELNGNLIIESNMHTSKWIHNFVINCVFINNVARHMTLLLTKHCRCYIKNNDYFDCKLLNTNFIKCTIKDSSFRNSFFTNVTFKKGKIQNVFFNESNIKKCRYLEIKDFSTCSWNGCTIEHCKFEEIRLISNKMYGIKLVSTNFINVKLWRSNFMGQFKKCRFQDVAWGGSELKNVQFIDCFFEDVNFDGAVIKCSKFVNCTFINTDFSKSQLTDTSFPNCTKI